MKKHDAQREGWGARELGKEGAYEEATVMKQRLKQNDETKDDTGTENEAIMEEINPEANSNESRDGGKHEGHSRS